MNPTQIKGLKTKKATQIGSLTFRKAFYAADVSCIKFKK